MKHLINLLPLLPAVIFAIVLTYPKHHSPKYKVGECFKDNAVKLEAWEKDKSFDYKMFAIGESHYLLAAHENGYVYVIQTTESIEYIDSNTHKTECPKYFEVK